SEFVVVDETSKNERTIAQHYGKAACSHRAQLKNVFVRDDTYKHTMCCNDSGWVHCSAFHCRRSGMCLLCHPVST
ncbi:hypothetical protein M404DRAFT_952179, partial [Pisolithus tinctorius Marx 270]